MKVLVTGAGGFVGSHVVTALIQEGHSVAAVRRPGSTSLALQTWGGNVAVHQAELCDQQALRSVFDEWDPEVVIHLAWYTEPGQYLHDRARNLECLEAGISLLRAVSRTRVRRLVIAGTCLENGNCTTAYAASKKMLHDVALNSVLTTIPVVCAHISSPYGPGEHPNRVLPSVIRSLLQNQSISLGSGQIQRDYIYVADVASAICLLATNNFQGAIDICTGDVRTLREVLNLVGTKLGKADLLGWDQLPSAPDSDFDTNGDTQALRKLGWQPTVTLDDGLDNSLQWWKQQLTAEEPAIGRRT